MQPAGDEVGPDGPFAETLRYASTAPGLDAKQRFSHVKAHRDGRPLVRLHIFANRHALREAHDHFGAVIGHARLDLQHDLLEALIRLLTGAEDDNSLRGGVLAVPIRRAASQQQLQLWWQSRWPRDSRCRRWSRRPILGQRGGRAKVNKSFELAPDLRVHRAESAVDHREVRTPAQFVERTGVCLHDITPFSERNNAAVCNPLMDLKTPRNLGQTICHRASHLLAGPA